MPVSIATWSGVTLFRCELQVAMQQHAGLRQMVDVGYRADHRVHQAQLGIHADVLLHPEVPLVGPSWLKASRGRARYHRSRSNLAP